MAAEAGGEYFLSPFLGPEGEVYPISGDFELPCGLLARSPFFSARLLVKF
jgi:hypothetical protein